MEEDLNPPSDRDTEFSLGDLLDKLCVYYMSMGMSFNEFWHGNIHQLEYFEKAYIDKVKHDNYMLWVEGGYIHNAVGIAIANAFRKKGTKALNYIEKPIDLFPKSDDERLEEERKRQMRMIEHLNSLGKKKKVLTNGSN